MERWNAELQSHAKLPQYWVQTLLYIANWEDVLMQGVLFTSGWERDGWFGRVKYCEAICWLRILEIMEEGASVVLSLGGE